jgi:lipase chaperone LimK
VRAVSVIASLLRRLGRPGEALPRLVAVRSLAESIGGRRILSEFYASLAQTQEALGDYAGALATERLAATQHEQLTSERARLRSTELEARLDLLQKEQAIDQLRSTVAIHEARLREAAADLAHVRSFRIAILDGLAAFAVATLSGILVWRYRSRTKRLHAAALQALRSSSPIGDAPPES